MRFCEWFAAISQGGDQTEWSWLESRLWARKATVDAAPALVGTSRLLRPPNRQRRSSMHIDHFLETTTMTHTRSRAKQPLTPNFHTIAQKSNFPAQKILSGRGNPLILIIFIGKFYFS